MSSRPRFFIAGAQRCGTTYLYSMLDEHPGICMARPVRPEPKFFLDDELYGRGTAWYEEHYFPEIGPDQIAGEKSTSYLESETAARRIQKHYPEAKIIISLRNPVDRALSNYRFSVANGLETRTPEEVFLEGKPAPDLRGQSLSVSPFDYLGRGEYSACLGIYKGIFGKDRLKLMQMESLTGNAGLLKSVYSFLDVSTDFIPVNLNDVINGSTENRADVSPAVREMLRSYYRGEYIKLRDYYGIDTGLWGC